MILSYLLTQHTTDNFQEPLASVFKSRIWFPTVVRAKIVWERLACPNSPRWNPLIPVKVEKCSLDSVNSRNERTRVKIDLWRKDYIDEIGAKADVDTDVDLSCYVMHPIDRFSQTDWLKVSAASAIRLARKIIRCRDGLNVRMRLKNWTPLEAYTLTLYASWNLCCWFRLLHPVVSVGI